MSRSLRRLSTLTALVCGAGFAVSASAQDDAEASANPAVVSAAEAPVTSLSELESIALQVNPQLARAAYIVAAARGRAEQAGLYPNPTLSVTFDELGDRTAAAGVNTLPLLSQEIVTAGKLELSRGAGLRQVNQETWKLMSRRYDLLADVRARYYEALEIQTRISILERMIEAAGQSVARSNELLKARQVARLDVVQLEIELERLRAELESSIQQAPGAYRNLAAAVGDPGLAIDRVGGDLASPLPFYDIDDAQAVVLAAHPDVHAARHGVERSRLLVERARREPIPNINVDAGYVRQNQNRSDDLRLGASVVVPLWNRNQGNIRAAEAEYCDAVQQVREVEVQLANRLAQAMQEYASSRRRAELYSTAILPRARETLELSRRAYQGGDFEYLRILEAQRALAQAYLDYVEALGESWRAAAVLSGLTLQDFWPPVEAEMPAAPVRDAAPDAPLEGDAPAVPVEREVATPPVDGGEFPPRRLQLPEALRGDS